jgi:hypothetical protein
MPITHWLHHADHQVAPIWRSVTHAAQRIRALGEHCVFRPIVTARSGIVTADFGIVTGRSGIVIDTVWRGIRGCV